MELWLIMGLSFGLPMLLFIGLVVLTNVICTHRYLNDKRLSRYERQCDKCHRFYKVSEAEARKDEEFDRSGRSFFGR